MNFFKRQSILKCLLVVWGLAVLIPISYFTAAHNAALPALKNPVQLAIGITEFRKSHQIPTENWSMTHVPPQINLCRNWRVIEATAD